MNRRAFFLTSAAAAAAPLVSSSSAADNKSEPGVDYHLSVATYSFRLFQRDYAVKAIKQLGVSYVDIKDFHLSMNDSPKQLAAGRKKFDDAGLKVVGGGNINLASTDDAELRRAFDYAKACGFPMMICAPTMESLPKVEKLAVEYNMKMAIHNHGPEDKHFPTPSSVLKAVKNMDPRMGLCIDIGHTVRTGEDVSEQIANAGPRLFEMHMKDLKDLKDKDSQVPVGDGAIPVPAIFRQLKKVGYKGVCSLEYEIEADNPMPGMMKSFSYMRGVLAGMNV